MMRIILVVAALVLVGCSPNAASSITYEEIPSTGDVERGQQLFNESIDSAPACSACHMPGVAASPDLAGFGERAGERVSDESAAEYAFYSIAEPSRYLVEGFGNVMYDQYDEKLAPQQIADLIAYLLTL